MKDKEIKQTAVNEYFSWLARTVRPESALCRAAHTYLEHERRVQETHTGPFLTVVTRTQGKRPDMLTEMLLCLTGQSNTDFELLVMGHNLTEEQRKTVEEILSDLPDWMREQTRLIPVNGGTRTTPLNAGFKAARGKYVAVLDDDDLVFDHWVDTFYRMHLEHDGKILHTYSIKQDWETVGGDYPDTPRAIGAPDQVYCRDFHLLDELQSNSCPLCALAFPSYVFHELGIRFDETLTTTEDWDYLMRASFFAGVANSSEATFLYRIWQNAESSASLHNKAEWNKNYKFIVNRLNETPILAAPGALKDVIDPDFIDGYGSYNSNHAELFYDDGEGFGNTKKWKLDHSNLYSEFKFVFIPLEEKVQTVRTVRFDPQINGFLTVRELLLRAVYADDTTKDFCLSDMMTNGTVIEDRLVFLKNDPQILLTLPEPAKLKSVMIACEIRDHVTDEDVDRTVKIWESQKKSIVYRGLRKIYRLAKKAVKK